jgi:hypothetical protein
MAGGTNRYRYDIQSVGPEIGSYDSPYQMNQDSERTQPGGPWTHL